MAFILFVSEDPKMSSSVTSTEVSLEDTQEGAGEKESLCLLEEEEEGKGRGGGEEVEEEEECRGSSAITSTSEAFAHTAQVWKQKHTRSKFRARGRRTTFESRHVQILENAFQKTPYLDRQTHERLSKETGITMSQIQFWFINRRRRLALRRLQPVAQQSGLVVLKAGQPVSATPLVEGELPFRFCSWVVMRSKQFALCHWGK